MNKCKSCSDPAAPGWHVDDDAGITFGGLKKAQNESAEEMAQYIAHIYFTKSSEVFNDLMTLIVDNDSSPFGGYSETCEWLAGKVEAKPDDWCASCNYLKPIAVDDFLRDDSDAPEKLCAECLARVNGWEFKEEMDISLWHCGQPGYWEDGKIFCSKCQIGGN